MNKFQISKTILLVTGYWLLVTPVALAARLYFEPSSGQYQKGDTFVLEARIDDEGECINAIDASLVFPSELLEAVDASDGGSFLSIWVKRPAIDAENGLISFAGGIPGGYCSGIIGEMSEKGNLLIKAAFKIIGPLSGNASAPVKFSENSKVFSNENPGKEAPLNFSDVIFTITPATSSVKNEWQEEIKKDKLPPEPFDIKLQKNQSIFEGKYFIAFSTTDKQSGILFYEVKEGDKDWKKVESPYLLESQILAGIIKVKAVDKAGNETIASLSPEKSGINIDWEKQAFWFIIISLIAASGYLIWKRKKTKQKSYVS